MANTYSTTSYVDKNGKTVTTAQTMIERDGHRFPLRAIVAERPSQDSPSTYAQDEKKKFAPPPILALQRPNLLTSSFRGHSMRSMSTSTSASASTAASYTKPQRNDSATSDSTSKSKKLKEKLRSVLGTNETDEERQQRHEEYRRRNLGDSVRFGMAGAPNAHT